MSELEKEMEEAAKAAILAGNRRKKLAASVSASSSSTSSGSGKRSHVSVQGTPSTKVTPDPKHTCGVVPAEPVQPVKLAFDDAAGNGTGDTLADTQPDVVMVPDDTLRAPSEAWQDAQSHHSMSLNLEPEETPADSIPEPGVASTEVPEHVTEGGPEPSVPAVGAPEPTPTEGGLEPSAPAVGAPETTPTGGPDPSVPAVAATPTPSTPPPVVSVGAALAAGYVTPPPQSNRPTKVTKANCGDDPVIQFTPVTSAGMSAFFAAFRRNSTQMSFATSEGGEGGHDSQEPVETLPASVTEAPVSGTVGESPASTEATVVVAPPLPKAGPVPTLLEPPVPAAPKACVAPPVVVPSQAMPMVPAAPKESTAAPPVVIPKGSVPTVATAAEQQTQPVPTQGATSETEDQEDRRAARAQYMRYHRSLRSVNCPEPIRQKFLEAQECPPGQCQQKLQELFEEWKRCNEDWLTSSMILEESRSHANSCSGIWKWITREELGKKYSAELAGKLCAEKEQRGETKPHPEFPGLPEMTLYYVWWEDSEVTTDTYKQTTNLVHETGFGPGGDDGDGNGGAGNSSVAVPKKGSGKNGAKGIGKGGRGKGKNIGIPQPPPVKKEKKEKKEKTPNQLARNAVALANNNILEIAQLNLKLTKAGVSEIIRRALVEQLKVCDGELKAAKAGLEQALAEDSDLTGPTSQLDTANANFKNQIKHANMHLPKATKPKAKAKSGAGQTTPA